MFYNLKSVVVHDQKGEKHTIFDFQQQQVLFSKFFTDSSNAINRGGISSRKNAI